jgi:hypothetical protein
MLVDSFSFTHDETAASVGSQAQLLVEAGWPASRSRRRTATPRTAPHGRPQAQDADEDRLFYGDTQHSSC